MYIIHTEVYNYYKYVLDHLHAEYPKTIKLICKAIIQSLLKSLLKK